MTRVRVLICDDAVMYATMVSFQFKHDADIDVVAVTSSAQEALEEADSLQPDVILLDHRLPDGSSEEVLPQFRSRVPDAAIVLVSGMPGDVLAEAAAAAGADGWVSKASSQDEVRAAILGARSEA